MPNFSHILSSFRKKPSLPSGSPLAAPSRSHGVTSSDRPARPNAVSSYPGMSWAFDAAKQAGYRGWFFFPTLEAEEQMPRWTRMEINRKANWLYNNVDAVRMVIDGLALDEVDGGIWPKWTTSNPAFNKLATDLFDNSCGDARFFSASAKENFYSVQFMIRRAVRLYGEIFAQFLRPVTSKGFPLVHFLNAWQCGNASTEADQTSWKDGVMTDRFGRAIRYRFLKNAEGSDWEDISADDILHQHDQFWNGQVRGMSALAPVARKLFSMADIEKSEISGTLLRTRLAYAITKKDDGDGLPPMIPGASMNMQLDAPGGGKLMVQKLISMDDSEVDVADLPAGQDIKVVESNRSTETPEFLRFLLEGVARATLYPPEYVFNLANLGQGTLVRMVQKRVQRIKNSVRSFQLSDQFCRRWVTYWTWQSIASGRFDEVEGGIPSDWWKVKFIMPADDTVDVAREGKLYDQRLEDGNMSPEEYHGMQGHDAEDVEDLVVAGAVRKARKIKTAIDANPDIADLIRFQLESRAGVVAEADPLPAEPEDDSVTAKSNPKKK